jgi:hypothetical protein
VLPAVAARLPAAPPDDAQGFTESDADKLPSQINAKNNKRSDMNSIIYLIGAIVVVVVVLKVLGLF